MHWGANVVATGLLFDSWGDDGRMGNACLVEAVRRRSHHVRGETAGHQAERAKGGNFLTVEFNSEPLLTWREKGWAKLAHECTALPSGQNLCLLRLSRLNSYTQWLKRLLFVQIKTFSKAPLFSKGWRKVECVVTMVTAWPWHLKPLSLPRSRPWRAFWQPSTQNTFTKCVSQFPIVNTMEHCNEQRRELSSISLYQTVVNVKQENSFLILLTCHADNAQVWVSLESSALPYDIQPSVNVYTAF